MYNVRVIGADELQNEEYYYYKLEDAKKHLNCSKTEDPNLFHKIEIIDSENPDYVYDTVDRSEPLCGRWGRLRLDYLKNYATEQYRSLVSCGKLYKHLLQVEKDAQETFDNSLNAIQKSDLTVPHEFAIMNAEEKALQIHIYN